MRKRYWRRMLYCVPVVLLKRCLDLAEKYSEAPEQLLLNAVAGKVTDNFVATFALTTESIVFLVLFLILFGDCISEQQRTGAAYRFSRMPSRRPWFLRSFIALGGYAFGYCGVFIGLHALISLMTSEAAASAELWSISLSLWIVFSLIAWCFATGCNLLCGRFGASVGVMLCVLLTIVLSVLSAIQGMPLWAQLVDPASFIEEIFTSGWRAWIAKSGILCVELLAVTVPAGRYFSTKDIFESEGDG